MGTFDHTHHHRGGRHSWNDLLSGMALEEPRATLGFTQYSSKIAVSKSFRDPARVDELIGALARYQTAKAWRGTGSDTVEPQFEPGRHARPGKATLSLEDDVVALLERARRRRGRSLDEMANEFLRQILAGFDLATPQPNAGLEAKIDEIYDEIRELVVRSAKEPGLESEIADKRRKLQELQAEEAEAWRRQAEAQRHLRPGDGYRLLKRAEGLLAP